jgi:aspartate aminotransferase
MKLADRVASVAPSATLAMTARAKALKAAGVDVLDFSAGEPDFDTPRNIKDAAKQALERGDTKYTPVPGTAELRKAIAKNAGKEYHRAFEQEHVIVGVGGKQVIFNACVCLLNPGDEAVIPSPYWVSYPDMVRFAGGKPIFVPADESKGFLPDARAIAAAVNPRTRVLFLNSPSNPTGATYARRELEDIAEVVRAYPDLVVITDDMYGALVYDAPFVSIAHVAPDLSDRLLIASASGVSKSYAMTGWRIGYGVGPKELISAMNRIQGASTSGACSIAQAAALEAITGDQTAVTTMRDVFKQRRDRIIAALRGIRHLEVFAPGGAFYVFPRVNAYFGGEVRGSQALAELLIDKAHVATVAGDAFGSDAHLRLSFACSEATIDEGVRRLKVALGELRA